MARCFNFRLFLPFLVLLPLSACASFSGAQAPLSAKNFTAAANKEATADLDRFSKAPTEDERKAIRNVSIAKHMMAIDDQYDAFIGNLSKELRGTNAGLDIGILALTGVGSVVSGAASELSAGAAALTGARATLNKELYLERTLPAILIAMDTNRLRISSSITDHMRLAASDYSLAEALIEVRKYERAGNLNRAITELTSAASTSFAAAEKDYGDAKSSCEPALTLRPIRRDITNFMYLLSGKLAKGFAAAAATDDAALTRIASFVAKKNLNAAKIKATTIADFESQRAAISNYVLLTCTEQETTEAKTLIVGGQS